MAQVYAAKYLAKAALSAPRDLVRAAVAKYTPLHPTVLIFHCTFVCDARCEMCSNWTRGDRKADLTLAQIEQAFSSNLWKDIENASLSGGEPTTRNDMVDICRVMIDKFPKLRKLTINTTGLTPHRAIPMLTKVVEMCHERNVIFSTRVSIDGVNDMHGEVRNVKRAFEKAGKTIAAMQELQKKYPFNFGISSTIFSKNLDDADNILAWARKEKLDIVFNMVRFTEAMLGNAELAGELRPMGLEEQRMRKFFLDRVRQDPLLDGQNYIYMHYADMIGNGYHRTGAVPVPDPGRDAQPQRRRVLLREQRRHGQRQGRGSGDDLLPRDAQAHRRMIRDEKCPTCLSPCQMNVAAIKQVVPYARFLVRASMEKRRVHAEPQSAAAVRQPRSSQVEVHTRVESAIGASSLHALVHLLN